MGNLTSQILYNNPANFSFDSDKIEIAGSLARLKLVSNPGQQFSQLFDSSSGFTYNSALVEFLAGVMRQKDQRPSGASFYNSFLSKDASWSSGVGTGTLLGSPLPTISGGFLVMSGAAPQGVSYAVLSNFIATQTGCIRMQIRPKYSGTPTNDQYIFELAEDASASSVNRIRFFHRNNGNLEAQIFDASGSLAITVVDAFSPVANTVYEVEINWNATAGSSRLFVDGVQLGSTNTATATRTLATANKMWVGTGRAIATNSLVDIGSVLLFDAVQHTAGYTPGEVISETIYALASASLPAMAYGGLGAIQALESIAITDAGVPKYTVEGKYWNGSAWVASDATYAQANSAAEVIANIASLGVSGETSIEIVVYFAASNSISSVDSIVLDYEGQVYPSDGPSIEQLSGVTTEELVSLTPSLSGSVKFILKIGGVLKYWNGSDWATSDGSLAQSNTSAEINANVASLSIADGAEILVRALLDSDGSSTPTLTSVALVYDFAAPTPADKPRSVVYAFLKDIVGDAVVSNAKFIVELQTLFVVSDVIVKPTVLSVNFDSRGYAELDVLSTPVGKTYLFKITYENEQEVQKTLTLGEFNIPSSSPTVNIASLLGA